MTPELITKKPRKKRAPNARPSHTVSISVNHPADALFLLRHLSFKRSLEENRRVPMAEIYEEIVGTLIKEIYAEVPIIFYPVRRQAGAVRRSTWFSPEMATEIKKLATRFSTNDSIFVMTAVLRYFERQGQSFEGWPKSMFDPAVYKRRRKLKKGSLDHIEIPD